MDSELYTQRAFGLLAVDRISAMLAYWDKDLVCRFANAAYGEWFGKSSTDMVNKITLPELLGEMYALNEPHIKEVFAGKTQSFEREIVTPGGAIRYTLATYYPDSIDGEVKGFFVHGADVTPLKLLEIEALKSDRKIREQNERLLSFANIVSHNLKSYSNNLGTILNLFLKANSEEEKAILLNYLQGISKGFSATINHLGAIIEVQNETKLVLEPINLYDFVEHVLDILSVEIQATGTVIINNINRECRVTANPAYMESIILNLLTNAIKYRQPNRNPVIKLTAQIMADTVEFRVQDNGLGIDLARHKAALFGLYKTFHKNPDAKGIGLFITRLQIEAMNGKINVESQVDSGTTFIITLPA